MFPQCQPWALTAEQLSVLNLHGYPASLVMEVQSLIDAANKGDLAPNTALGDIWSILESRNICKEEILNVDAIACHPCNRGKLGLNGYNVHKNIHQVDQAGVDINELGKAHAFELCPIDPLKSQQLAFNSRLVDISKGLLAPLKGTESKLSVGTGHFTAGARAIKAGCKTCIPSLKDSNGQLSADRFRKKDHRWSNILDKGWSWKVWPWQTEIAWPLLPDLAQRSLNSSHAVSSRSTENEVMVWVVEACKDHSKTTKTEFHELMQTVAKTGPVCAPYIGKVGELALQIGGGSHGSVLFSI